MYTARQAEEELEQLEKLPHVKLTHSAWIQTGTMIGFRYVEVCGELIAHYDVGEPFKQHHFVYHIYGTEFYGEVPFTDAELVRSRVKEFVERVSAHTQEMSQNLDNNCKALLGKLEEIREIVPERFQDDNPEKFMQKIREYILCLQFAKIENSLPENGVVESLLPRD
nr:hypothetical protein K-LCC10_0140 [Kaumoebavirus]